MQETVVDIIGALLENNLVDRYPPASGGPPELRPLQLGDLRTNLEHKYQESDAYNSTAYPRPLSPL